MKHRKNASLVALPVARSEWCNPRRGKSELRFGCGLMPALSRVGGLDGGVFPGNNPQIRGDGLRSRMVSAAELQKLLEAVARRDENAFEQLYAATSAKLYGTVLRVLRRSDLAREVVEDTYASVWDREEAFVSSGEPPMIRLVAAARERALDAARNRIPETADESAATEPAAEDASSVDRQDLTDGLRKLLACLGELGPERRRLILLAYYGGWTRAQLAAKFATDVENVGRWLRGSLMQLRECLES